jgi:hypothetical protein
MPNVNAAKAVNEANDILDVEEKKDEAQARSERRVQMAKLADNKVVRGMATAVQVVSFVGGCIAAVGATVAGVKMVKNRGGRNSGNNGGSSESMTGM